MVNLPYRDRTEAGRLLGAELATRKFPANTMVLALTRGGVPVGLEVAEALKCPLDIVVVRKLGVPWQPELAMGAIAGETRFLNQELIRELGISEGETEQQIAEEAKEMHRREKLYRDGLPAAHLAGRTVIIIDDGLATGSTMIAAARYVAAMQPQRVIVAIPVASIEGCSRLAREADECICLAKPRYFLAVGQWYERFPPVGDAEVCKLLKHSRNAAATVA